MSEEVPIRRAWAPRDVVEQETRMERKVFYRRRYLETRVEELEDRAADREEAARKLFRTVFSGVGE